MKKNISLEIQLENIVSDIFEYFYTDLFRLR